MEQEFENTQPYVEPPQPPQRQTPPEPYYPYGTFPPQPPKAPKPPKKGKSAGGIIALALCFSLLGGIVGAGGTLAVSRYLDERTPEASAPTQPDQSGDTQNSSGVLKGDRENSVLDIVEIDTSKQMTPAEVYAANVNSTVGITTSITTNYWGYQSTSAASGSGFIITDDGYILTNYHVIEDSDSITVSLYDGTSYDAALIGYDQSNDIAVLKVEAEGLVPVVIGDSDNLNVGDSVLAIGNPLGELTFTLTVGAVSAKDREVTFSSNVTMELIQTDCAINSGNSGGALFNLYGEVIGITNAKYSGSSSSGATIDNIGFAIPINNVWSIIQSIIEKGYVAKPYMGITVTDVSEETQSYGIPQGAAVYAVASDSPAEKAGLQQGDVITKAGDTEITCGNDIVSYVGDLAAGDVVELTVYRRGQTLTIQVTIEEQIQSAIEEEEEEQPQQSFPQMSPWG